VLPDDLTALGVAAAIGICAAYVLSNEGSAWLWVASALLVVHEGVAEPNRLGLIGPTEMRVVLIALNTALALRAGLEFSLLDTGLTALDLVGLAAAAVMVALLIARAARNLRELSKEEPAASRAA
jgi:hypothetical protein